MYRPLLYFFSVVLMLVVPALVIAQEASVKPGINDSFQDPDAGEYTERFEVESREVFALRKEILAASGIQPGQTVADIGAGTGLFTRLFSEAVGAEGRVIAVDISANFLEHIRSTARDLGLTNIDTVLCDQESTGLPPRSVDVAFICDTYHHFEFPQKTMASLHRALKPEGRVVMIDFHRQEGISSEWTLNHVRAGQEVFEAEILEAGFRKVDEIEGLLTENYFVVFEKVAKHALVTPLIDGSGGVVHRPAAVDGPLVGAKAVFDVTADSPTEGINKGLDRAARLLNLYGAAGHQAGDLKLTLVMHGDATKTVLSDESYRQRFGAEANPNLPLLRRLQAVGVEVLVCGQALNYKGFDDSEVTEEVPIAASAMTVIINRQATGHAYLPMP